MGLRRPLPDADERTGPATPARLARDLQWVVLAGLRVTPANEQERAQVAQLAQAVQAATTDSVEVVFVDQGYTGEQPAEAVQQHGIHLEW